MLAVSDLTVAYRRANVALRAATVRDLTKLWPALDWSRLDETYPAWLAGVALLIRRDHARAADIAGSYLRAFRLASGVPGEAKVLLAAPLPDAQIATVMRVSAVVAAKDAARRGAPAGQAMRNAFVLTSGEASKLALNGGRDTVRLSCASDDRVRGWRRVGSTGSCDFCSLLLARDAVYREDTAQFEAHGHCQCSAEPVY